MIVTKKTFSKVQMSIKEDSSPVHVWFFPMSVL
uniref:Uncharacterized protein n=1 Tax=Anguilla anguilla TaxID=7936 RepID=A0A0E9VBJ9_ANGAN